MPASLILLALAAVLAARPAHAACGAVAANYPVVGDARLELGNGGRVNNTPFASFSGTTRNALDWRTATTVDVTLGFSGLEPPTFPPNTATNNLTASTVPPGSYNRVTAVARSTTFTGGVYHIRELVIPANTAAFMGPGTYFVGRMTLANGSRVFNSEAGDVRIHIGTELVGSGSGNQIFSQFGLSRMAIFVHGPARFELANNSLFNGLVYAPDPGALVAMGNGATLNGAMVSAGTARLGNNARITYTAATEAFIQRITTCSGGPDHFAISHGGTAVTCQPEPVTIVAHDAAHNPVTYGGVLSLVTSTARGDWAKLSGAGTLANGAVNDGAATYAFGNESTVVLALRHTQPGPVNISLSSASVGESPTEDPVLSFADSGFRFIDGAALELIANQVAGTASPGYFLQAIRTDTRTGACTGVFGAGQTVTLELAFQCNDPITCAGRQVGFTNGAATTLLAANGNAGVSAWTAVPVTFLNDGTSRAAFSFAYADAGRIGLHARYNLPLEDGSPSGNFMLGSSNPLVVSPAGFVLSAIRRSADGFANPAAADAGGPAFIAAGDPFSVTVTAVASDGVTALPNFGRETSAEGVVLSPGLVAPAGGAIPPLANADAFSSFSAGAATGTTFAWPEVGIIALTPAIADGDYLGAGNVTGPVSANVGRFIPHHFGFAAPGLTNRAALGCSPASVFSYMDEGMSAAFTLTAQSRDDLATQNYAGLFAKLDPTVPASFGFGARDGTSDLSSRLDLASSTGTWALGSAAISTSLAFKRRTAPDDPDGPYEALRIGVAPADGDGVRLAASTLDLDVNGDATNDHAQVGQTRVRFGRLRLDSAHGSELLSLPVPALTQYWNGSVFVTHAEDDCTTFAAGDFALTSFSGNLAAGETTVTPTTVAFADGRGNLVLSAPGSGNNGSAILSIDLAAAGKRYLQGRWDATDQGGDGSFHDDNPSARVSFGIYRGGDEFIYRRENF